MNRKIIARIITGSYAYGTATDKSDIDIVDIVKPTKEEFLRGDFIFNAQCIEEPVDLRTMSFHSFCKQLKKGSMNCFEILNSKYIMLPDTENFLAPLKIFARNQAALKSCFGHIESEINRFRYGREMTEKNFATIYTLYYRICNFIDNPESVTELNYGQAMDVRNIKTGKVRPTADYIDEIAEDVERLRKLIDNVPVLDVAKLQCVIDKLSERMLRGILDEI